MKEYLKAQGRTNSAIIENTFSTSEINRFSKSDLRWVDNKTRTFRHRPIKKGEIYQFEFGKNYIPEMSYEHRGLVIGIKQKLLYVLPIFSYDPQKHPEIYHPKISPDSKSDLFLLKNDEFSFISHDSVLKLNDIRTVSVNRILYQHNGRIDPSSDTYKQIEALTLQKYFPAFYHDFKQNLQTIESLNEQLKKTIKTIDTLKTENKQLKADWKALQEQEVNTQHEISAL